MSRKSGQIMRKRQKFVVTAILSALGLWLVHAVPIPLEWKYGLIALWVAGTGIMSGWGLAEGLTGIEWVTVNLPQMMFAVGAGLFYILLPALWWVRLGAVVFYAVGQYALLLTGNIFSVAAIRTIALFRAATAVGFVMTLLTGFLLYNSILSFRFGFWWVGLLVFLVSACLLFPALWSVELEARLSWKTTKYCLWTAVLLGLLAIAVSFWPVSLTVSSLFLTTMLYIYLGIVQHHFSQRLFSRTVWEYVIVGAVVLTTMLLTAGLG